VCERASQDWWAHISRLEGEQERRLEAHARLLAEVAERVAALERRVDRTAARLMRHQVALGAEAHGGGGPPWRLGEDPRPRTTGGRRRRPPTRHGRGRGAR
jgi:hypothetical protein